MHYEWLDAYLLSFPGVEKDYQPVWQWFRYKVRGRLFAAVCSPGPEYKIYGGHDLVNLKCGAAEGELLRARYPDILPGFYSDKRTWISCLLDGELPEEVLRDLCGGHTPWRWRSCPNTSGGSWRSSRGELRCLQWRRKKRKRPM